MRRFFKTSYPPLFFFNHFNLIPQEKIFPFSFHIWSTIPDFLTFPWHTAFQCSSSHTFSGRHVLPLNILLQLHGMECTQFLVMLGAWLGKDIIEKSCYWGIFSRYHLGCTSLKSFRRDLWYRAEKLGWFSAIILCRSISISWSRFYALWVVVAMEVVSSSRLDTHHCN